MIELCTECGLCRDHCHCPQEIFDMGAGFRPDEDERHCRECEA